jgi:hypothetical protein
MSRRGWALLIICIIVGVIVVIATPFIVYLLYALTCKGPDCFR